MCATSHFQTIGYIGSPVRFVIDRPRGSPHPEFPDLIYEVDYGYIPDTRSGDGEELDAYIFGPSGACRDGQGFCVGAILREDNDDKLIVIAKNEFRQISPELVWQLTAFQEKFFWPEVYTDIRDRYMLTKEGVIWEEEHGTDQ